MANGGRPPVTPLRRFTAVGLGAAAVFVILFGLGSGRPSVMAVGAAVLILAIAMVTVSALRGNVRAWVRGEAHVVSASEPPASSAYGRCELQIVIDAPGLPAADVRIIETRVPVAKWPSAGATLPILVAVDDARRARVQWDEVMTHREAAEERAARAGTGASAPAREAAGAGAGSAEGASAPAAVAVAERPDHTVGQPAPAGPEVGPDPAGPEPVAEQPGRGGATDAEILDEVDRIVAADSEEVEDGAGDAVDTGGVPAEAAGATSGRLDDGDSGTTARRHRPSPFPRPRTPADDLAGGEPAGGEPPGGGPAGQPRTAGFELGLTLLVSDLTRSTEFYRDLLGFRRIAGGPDHVVLVAGPNRLVLRRMPGLAREGLRRIYLNFEVRDIVAAHAELRDRGVRFLYPPKVMANTERQQMWEASFRDPDGYALALTQWRDHGA